MAGAGALGLALPGASPSDGTAALGAAQASARAAGGDRTKARAAAQQFEQVFLSNMLNTMVSGLHGSGPFGDAGPGGDVWRSMLTEQYAAKISAAGGIGIADAVMRELMSIQENRQ
jgi:Rod binding domain-containing protein